MQRTVSAVRSDSSSITQLALAVAATALVFAASGLGAQQPRSTTLDPNDPRVGLRAGWMDAGVAAHNMELVGTGARPEGFVNPRNPGDFGFANSDIAFRGELAIVGNFNGFQIYDVSDPANPRIRSTVACAGGQGDVSVHGDLVFMSVEETRGRLDCGPGGAPLPVDPARFRGVRIFDISNLDAPRQIASVQTCRGSHTHTILTHPGDDDNLYVYVSGTSGVRPAEELAGCSRLGPEEDPQTSLFRIEVIRVPLAAPHTASIVSMPRVFADRTTGAIAGLWAGGDHGPETQSTSQTNQCHDITVYPAIGLAGGACSGNGILLDISDPVNPRRIHEVIDPNFAYWHSATFNNDGSKVIFTDEWGGGVQARCRATDRPEWGANAIFDIVDGRMQLASYYKIPAPQTATENCVAHNGSLIPVPGRDIKVQAWYQGGISVFDFTDSANPFEIAYFDRGPISDSVSVLGGFWSAYWYNGLIYGSEIARGLDIFQLVPSEHLSQNEIDAAKLVRFDEFNPQNQPKMEWPRKFVVARAYLDQLHRSNALPADRASQLSRELEMAERVPAGAERTTVLAQLGASARMLENDAASAEGSQRRVDANRLRALAELLREFSTGAR
jgi:hypothetical protein